MLPQRTRGVLARGDDLVPGQHLADQVRLRRSCRIQQHVRQPRGDVRHRRQLQFLVAAAVYGDLEVRVGLGINLGTGLGSALGLE